MRKQTLKVMIVILTTLFTVLYINNRAYSEGENCDPDNPESCVEGESCEQCPEDKDCYKCVTNHDDPPPPPPGGCPKGDMYNKCSDDSDCSMGFKCTPQSGGNIKCCMEDNTLVELSLFEALYDKGKVTIHWVTESEKDTAGFDIERSLKPHEGYERINIVMIPNEGDTITGAEYSFVDKNIKREKYYYKLKEYELNGTVNHYGPTEIDLRPKGKTKPPKTKKPTPVAEKSTPEQKKLKTDLSPLIPTTVTSNDKDISSRDKAKQLQKFFAIHQEATTAKKPAASPKGWIKTPFPITITGKDKGWSGNKKNSKRWQPATAEQEANGPAKTIAWSEVANVIYVSQRNLSNKDLFLKLVDGKVIVVNKTNPDYFRFADTIENEQQLTERLKEIGVSDTKPILTIWRESHENKQ